MRNTSTALALIMAVSAGPAIAAAQWTFKDIDADGNLELTDREFQRVSRDIYTRLDANQDQRLDQTELSAGNQLFETSGEVQLSDWDTAGDGTVDWAEFHARAFDLYDDDNDDFLNDSEFGPIAQAELGGAAGAVGNQTIQANEIIPLAQWRYDDLYRAGFSVENFMDEMEVYGATGEEIGEVEDVIFGSDGRVLSVVAEIGGFLDIGDTHVSIPWNQIDFRPGRDGITVPVTEDNIEDYGLFATELIEADAAQREILTEVDDDPTGPRAWRATELIGDYARLKDKGGFLNYGYINDLIIQDGQLAAVLVNPDVGYGAPGMYAYPYYGYGFGWAPGRSFYDLPYSRDEIGGVERFDRERFEQS